MSMRWPAGVVSKTAITPSGPYSTSTAPGIWRLNDVSSFIQQNNWPNQNSDAYFDYVSLLLNGEVQNGLSSTVISDASTNQFQLSSAGNFGNSYATPYSSAYSNYFDGTTSWLSITDNAALDMESSDFTMECWIYPNSSSSVAGQTIFGKRANNSNVNGVLLGFWNSTLQPTFYATLGGGTWTISNITSSIAVTPFAWNHVALTRNGSTWTVWVNGVSGATTTQSGTVPDNSYAFTIGSTAAAAGSDLIGNCYLSNCRIVKGTAVYTSNFTPSTAPLTAISGTSLLTCQSNRFIDNSTNAFAITVAGNTSISQYSPFADTTSAYGSGYFDGSTGYATVPDNSAIKLTSGDWTLEFWMKAPSAQSLTNNGIYTSDFTAGYSGIVITANSSRQVQFTSSYSGTAWDQLFQTIGTYTDNAWAHIAVAKSGSTIYGYFNGVLGLTITSVPSTIYSASSVAAIGKYSTSYYKGNISNFRIVKGTCLYPSGTTFTPPTSPLTAVTNTSLLTLQTSAPNQNNAFLDSSANNFTITRNGNTTQGTFSPYGSLWSNYFDGTGDYLTAPDNAAWDIGSAKTIEAWVYLTSGDQKLICGQVGQFWLSTGATALGITAGKFGISFYTASDTWYGVSSTTSYAPNRWYHVAATWDGTYIRMFVNGVLETTSPSQSGTTWKSSSAGTLDIGTYSGDPNTYGLIGYISNLRITNSALYTATFSVPTAPLSAVANTVLLTCQSNRFKDNSSNNFAITVNGDTKVTRFSPFNPTAAYSTNTIGGSGYFDGTGDYLTTPTSGNLALGSGSWTIEFWVYPVGTNSDAYLFDYDSGANRLSVLFDSSYSNRLVVYDTGYHDSGFYITRNAWSHVALVRNGTTVTFYVNGIAGNSYTDARNLSGTPKFTVASYSTPSYYLTGNISNFRAVVGTALYTSAFTPSTSPLTAVSGTSLLCNFTNAGIPDLAMQNDLETVGNAQVSTSVKKYGTGSLAFDGTGDWLTSSYNTSLDLGAGNFTIEGWVYPTTAATQVVWAVNTNSSGFAQAQCSIKSDGTWYMLISTSSGAWVSTTTGGSYSANNWYHVAIVRNGSSFVLYINGISALTQTTSSALYAYNGPTRVGTDGSSGTPFTGYIDDLRITNGYARYTANFTPPTSSLQNM